MRNGGAATRSRNDEIGPAAFERIAVIGGGAWGTAIALTAVIRGEPIDEAITRLMRSDLRAEPPSLEHLRIPHPAVTA